MSDTNDEAPVDEPEDAGADHEVPAELVELHEVLEWEATKAAEDAPE